MIDIKKYFTHTLWLIVGRVVKLFCGFIATIFIARYLGPEQFGILNYCFSIVSIAMIFAVLGVETIVLRELVKFPEDRALILGSSLFLQGIGVVIALICVFGFICFLDITSSTENLILVASLSILFRPFYTLRFYYEASIKGRVIACLESIQAVISITFKGALIVLDASLSWFVWAFVLDWILAGLLFMIHFKFFIPQGKKIFSVSLKLVKKIYLYSWPLLFSAVTSVFHQQIDRLMLKDLVLINPDHEVGIYSAAIRLCLIIFFVPQVIVQSLTPALVDAFKVGGEEYKGVLNRFSDIINWVGLILSAALAYLAEPVILLAYGSAFYLAVPVLKIAAWKGFLTATGMATGRQCTVENLQKYLFLRNLIGVVVNIAINLMLIPKYGALGAAVATLISMFVANIGSNVLIPPYRHIFQTQMVSIVTGWFRLVMFMNNTLKKYVGHVR